jgi:F-type H+-transporting ATPase subunit epsilon
MQVHVLSPAKVVVKTGAAQVLVPGSQGYMAILPGHAAMVAELTAGELKLKADAGEQTYFVSGGYVDVSKEQVTVLVDTIEKAGDIDTNRAEAARKRALDRLDQKVGVDLMRAQAALARAQQRLLVAGRK